MQEFVDARRQPGIQNAPQVMYTNREPPLELKGVRGLKDSESVGYVTFVLFPRHFATDAIRYETISRIQLFRDYLHYHIKCSKSYLNSRMRTRVAEFLKVLNRAKPETPEDKKEKKLARYGILLTPVVRLFRGNSDLLDFFIALAIYDSLLVELSSASVHPCRAFSTLNH